MSAHAGVGAAAGEGAVGAPAAEESRGGSSPFAGVGRLAGSRAARDLVCAVLASTAGALAVYLVGALAVQVRASLHFGPTGLGVAVALFYVGSGIGAVPFGRLAERFGAPSVMRVAALGAAVLLVLLATCASSWSALAGLLFGAGLVGAAMGPSTNLFLARRIRRERQGAAFGVKQATIPLAATCAGFAVPAIGLSIGWRWAFVLAAGLAALAAAAIPRRGPAAAPRAAAGRAVPGGGDGPRAMPRRSRRPLAVLAVGFTLSVLSVNGLNAFLVTAAVSSGFSKATAGLLAALGAGLTVTMRVTIGFAADRYGRDHLRIVLVMVLCGVAGYVALSIASATHDLWLFGIGAVTAYGAGWGWNGLFNYVVVRSHLEAPARATAVVQIGGCTAGVLGPVLFGMLVAHGSYSLAWSVVGGVMCCGCAVLAVAKGLLAREAPPPELAAHAQVGV